MGPTQTAACSKQNLTHLQSQVADFPNQELGDAGVFTCATAERGLATRRSQMSSSSHPVRTSLKRLCISKKPCDVITWAIESCVLSCCFQSRRRKVNPVKIILPQVVPGRSRGPCDLLVHSLGPEGRLHRSVFWSPLAPSFALNLQKICALHTKAAPGAPPLPGGAFFDPAASLCVCLYPCVCARVCMCVLKLTVLFRRCNT